MKNLSLTFCLTITALLSGGLATALHANTYQLTCVVDDSKFTTNYLIDENAKTIFQINSFNPPTEQVWTVNEYLKIIDWRNDRLVLTVSISELDEMPIIHFFNLKTKKLYLAGFYKNRKPHSDSRTCFSSMN
ncbi:hypothetical protein N9C56_13235 [Paracoccaceae bacterium]|nr:hypothetical protein [Paracoccaceae bacterium]